MSLALKARDKSKFYKKTQIQNILSLVMEKKRFQWIVHPRLSAMHACDQAASASQALGCYHTWVTGSRGCAPSCAMDFLFIYSLRLFKHIFLNFEFLHACMYRPYHCHVLHSYSQQAMRRRWLPSPDSSLICKQKG